MPLKNSLIQANESQWNAQQQIINFSIPSYISVVDLSQTSIILDVVVTDANGNDLGLYDVQFNNQYDPRCLVNYISLSTNKGGLVEEIQNSNVLSQNMLGFNKSTELLLSQSWLGQSQLGASYGSFLTKYITGNRPSIQRCSLPLPLKGLLGMGIQSQWLNQAWDGTNIQMNLDYMNVAGFFQQVKVENIACNNTADGASSTLVLTDTANDQCANPFYVGEPITVSYKPTWTAEDITALDSVLVVGVQLTQITLDRSPASLFIANGNMVTITGMTAGAWGNALNGNRVVANVDNVANTFTVAVDSSAFGADPADLGTAVRQVAQQADQGIITIISNIALSNANVITITVSPWIYYYGGTDVAISSNTSGNLDNTLSYRINSAQLSLVQQVLMPNQITMMSKVLSTPSNLSFLSWGVERVNMPTIAVNSSFVQLIDLLPNCRQVMILVPLPALADPLHSFQDNQASYRFSVDGVYTSNRSIVPFDSLYYNKLIEACANSKQVLAKMTGITNVIANVNYTSVVWCQSIPTDGMRHQLQYQYTQNATIGTANKIMYVFQCVDKSMNTQTALVMNS